MCHSVNLHYIIQISKYEDYVDVCKSKVVALIPASLLDYPWKVLIHIHINVRYKYTYTLSVTQALICV